MKKSLIALAVLAASGAAMAQSSVTLYGLVDTFYANVSTDNGAGVTTSTNVLNSGAVNGSRWGLKGSEDLGGGLKANFQLESGFNNDTGAAAQGGLLFGRAAWVGFSGGFGAVSVGRIATPYYDVEGAQDAVFNSALSPEGLTFRSSTAGNAGSIGSAATTRSNNTIKYVAPAMSGFGAALSYSLDEKVYAAAAAGATPAVAAGRAVTSLNLTYAGGPVAVSFAYQNEAAYNGGSFTGVAVPATYGDINFTRLQGSYDFGGIVAKLGFGKAGNVGFVSGADATEYMLGVDYKASSALTLSAGYANSSDNTTLSGVADQTRKGFGLGAAYSLSKRTFLYGGYNTMTSAKTATPDSKVSLIAAGVQHRF
ncbi:outer membrane porin protein 32 [Rhodoferax lithotrophicus]|uniref:Outer membrane porin protein 32 n=2 Tax=Rhodoferax lithotrophicus TaxID=2798804 RepID=A0ABN6DAI0_9BURK|nr:outer membrane porin protein 32 [Rhodoferax sp. MIZ03]